jgi:hypothetical protein
MWKKIGWNQQDTFEYGLSWNPGIPECRDLIFVCEYRLRARVLKHLVESEKSTFQVELSFQRSECIQQGSQ